MASVTFGCVIKKVIQFQMDVTDKTLPAEILEGLEKETWSLDLNRGVIVRGTTDVMPVNVSVIEGYVPTDFTIESIDLSDEEKQDYCRTGGAYCPFCRSNDLDVSPVKSTSDGSAMIQPVKCRNCKEMWNDKYKLAELEVVS